MKIKKLFGFVLAATLIANIAPVVAEEDEDEDNEIELTSAVITAEDCAKKAAETENYEILGSLAKCPPHKIFEGIPGDKIYTAPPKIVVFDVTEGEYYYIKPNPEVLTWAQLLLGFGGSLDGSGVIVGKKGDIPVVEFEEAEITPRPKPGFFKGCL